MHGLCPIPRNIKDELILGIAAGGGVVGVNFLPAFLDCGYRRIEETRCKGVFSSLDRRTEKAGADPAAQGRAWMEFTRDHRRAVGSERLPLEKLLLHFDYLIDLAGEEVPAFGSDFDGIPNTPEGVEDCRGFVNILKGLAERGYSRDRLEKICWTNFLRVFTSVCG
jgi:membrane dipeptidase